jgi:hypothetical protein
MFALRYAPYQITDFMPIENRVIANFNIASTTARKMMAKKKPAALPQRV